MDEQERERSSRPKEKKDSEMDEGRRTSGEKRTAVLVLYCPIINGYHAYNKMMVNSSQSSRNMELHRLIRRTI